MYQREINDHNFELEYIRWQIQADYMEYGNVWQPEDFSDRETLFDFTHFIRLTGADSIAFFHKLVNIIHFKEDHDEVWEPIRIILFFLIPLSFIIFNFIIKSITWIYQGCKVGKG